MHLNAKPPIFVPDDLFDEMDRCSKAALMDMVWDFCVRCTLDDPRDEFRRTRDIIETHRKRDARPIVKRRVRRAEWEKPC